MYVSSLFSDKGSIKMRKYRILKSKTQNLINTNKEKKIFEMLQQ